MEDKLKKYELDCQIYLQNQQIDKLEDEINDLKVLNERNKKLEDNLLDDVIHLKRKYDVLLEKHSKLTDCLHKLEDSKVEPSTATDVRESSSYGRRSPHRSENDFCVPMEYRPKNIHDLRRYTYNNKICVRDFMHHYQIPGTKANGDTFICSCTLTHTFTCWHASQMKENFPMKYSKFAALCQVTSQLFDKGRKVDAQKLCEAIWEDRDGFFSLDVSPVE